MRDRVKHKPVKQKVQVKKEKTEESKGYDEQKSTVDSRSNEIASNEFPLLKN